MSVLELDNGRIFYEALGDEGEWITLISGHMRPCSDFRTLARFLVKRKFRVLLFDNRGSGKSICGNTFSLADMTEDIILLWMHLEIKSSHVAGFSMGGIIAQSLAVTLWKKDPFDNFVQGSARSLLSLTLVSTAAPKGQILLDDPVWPDDRDAIEHRLASNVTPEYYEKNRPLFAAMAKNIHTEVRHTDFNERTLAQRRALAESALFPDELRHLRCKTIIIHGEQDRTVPLAEANRLKELIPNATLHVIGGAGHLLLIEKPDVLFTLLVS